MFFLQSVGLITSNLIAHFIICIYYLILCGTLFKFKNFLNSYLHFEDISCNNLTCLLSFACLQAEEGVAETEVLSEEWIFNH